MSKHKSWFEVDKKGLEKLLQDRPKSFLLYELVQNAWDETDATEVDVSIVKVSHRPYISVVVTDDSPEGFKRLSDAFTFYAESYKKTDPSKRGRFNLGEKLVLACCEEARIETTTGSIMFHKDGERSRSQISTKTGSVFYGQFKATEPEFLQIIKDMENLIPPSDKKTMINGSAILSRIPVTTFTEQLPTMIADAEGNLKKSARKTLVEIYEPKADEKAMIYEMGIPVVETGDRFHINIMQKVPLNMDRDNVPPAYLKTIRVHVLNNTINFLSEEDTASMWVNEAMGDKRCEDSVVNTTMDKRFGSKRVAFDPSDPEANKIAISKGYTVVSGRTLSKGQWERVKGSSACPPAGQVTPSQPFTDLTKIQLVIPEDKWTKKMKTVVNYSKMIASKLIDVSISVKITNNKDVSTLASYGNANLTLNVGRLGKVFFNRFPDNMESVDDLLIHELAHHYSGDHLSDDYYRACTRLGAKLKRIALEEPKIFDIA